jgi:IS605 OrfB family transposase
MELRDLLATENTKQQYKINYYYSFHINNLKEQIKILQTEKIKYKENKYKLLQKIIEKELKSYKDQLDYEESLLKEELKKKKYMKNQLISSFELNVSNEIRSNAIKSVCDAYKSGFTNLRNGNIRYFNINFKKKSEKRKCIELANSEINITNGKFKICPGKLKKNSLFKMGKRNTKKYNNLVIKNNCDLLKINNNYYINVTVPIKNNKIKNMNKCCGVDPGVRTFATVYSPNNENIYEYDQTKLSTKLNKLNDKINLLKSFRIKRKDKYKLYNILTNKKKRVKKEKFIKIESKKTNLVNELHWLTINNLIKNNDIIFYGDIKSHDIVKGGKNRILNRNFNDLKFYIFKQRLKYKAIKNGKIVYLINESYTSQGCSTCGNLDKKLGSSKIYDCKICKLKTGRDVNASKNIYMKGLITCM